MFKACIVCQFRFMSLPEIRVILRHEYPKTVLKDGSPMLQRNVWKCIASSNKSNSACRPLIDKLVKGVDRPNTTHKLTIV